MKTYIRYRVGLFIGLLIFNTLPGCVNVTRSILGGNGTSDEGGRNLTSTKMSHKMSHRPKSSLESDSDSDSDSDLETSSTISSTIKVVCALVMGGVMTSGMMMALWGLLSGVSYVVNHSPVYNNVDMNHGNGLVPYIPSLPIKGRPNLKSYSEIHSIDSNIDDIEERVMHGIEINTARWGPILHRNKTLKHPRVLKKLKHRMHLSKRILRDLDAHDFSKKRIQYWLDRNLDINATDKYGSTMLKHAAACNDEPAFQFILDKGGGCGY